MFNWSGFGRLSLKIVFYNYTFLVFTVKECYIDAYFLIKFEVCTLQDFGQRNFNIATCNKPQLLAQRC